MRQNSPFVTDNIPTPKASPVQAEHYVQFYQSESDLLSQLSRYVQTGLRQSETCLVVATQAHRQQLEEWLLQGGVDVASARLSGSYLSIDAADTLRKFMGEDMPNKVRFQQTVGSLVETLASKNKPLRIYGEMVALLWKDGNKEAVLELENMWNELLAKHPCNLFCAYPELHFIMDRAVHDEIADCHTWSASSLATA
jgi:hypothetical protein